METTRPAPALVGRARSMAYVGVLFGTMSVLGAGSIQARVAVEPVRRDARIAVNESISYPPFTSSTPAFVSADFVIPRATTREMAEYQEAAGAPAAARWLCDTYTAAPSFDPEAASLRGLVNAAAAQGRGGMAAADALVCPSIRQHVRHTVRVRSGGCPFGSVSLFGLHADCSIHVTRYRVMSHDLAYAGCRATDEERQALDSATCQRVLLGRSGRASALRFFTRSAARKHDCLRLTLAAAGSRVRLFAHTRSCE